MEQVAVSNRSAGAGASVVLFVITTLSSVACAGADDATSGAVRAEALRAEAAGNTLRPTHVPHCARRAASERYRVTDIGSLASPDDPFAFVTVNALNESAQVVGTSHWTDENGFIFFRAFEWQSGVMSQLSTPQALQSSAGGINEAGMVVGSVGVPSFASRAVAWDGTETRDLGTLGGPFSHADDINDAGIIVGQAQVPGDDSAPIHAFVYTDGHMQDLGTFGGTISRAYAINASGQIVGEAETAVPGEMRAFLYEGGTLTDIFPGPGRARDINDGGQIVGEVDVWGDAGFQGSSGVVYDQGQLNELGLGNLPLALNNAGTIVGTGVGKAGAEPVTPDGFVLRDGKFRFLRDLIDQCWQTISPIDVNDEGQIIATAHTCEETPRMRVLLLKPVTVCGRGRPK